MHTEGDISFKNIKDTVGYSLIGLSNKVSIVDEATGEAIVIFEDWKTYWEFIHELVKLVNKHKEAIKDFLEFAMKYEGKIRFGSGEKNE